MSAVAECELVRVSHVAMTERTVRLDHAKLARKKQRGTPMTSHSRVNLDYSPLLCNIIHYLEQLNLKINNTNSDV